ncbi:MAG: hypothetical protein AB1714_29140 [Acidobacteriota bacterium]
MSEPEPRAGRTSRYVAGALFCIGAIVLLWIVVPPRLTVFPAMDEGVYLTAADRIGRGQMIYRDFFEFLPPGYFYLLGFLARFPGLGIAGLRALMVLVMAVHACILWALARRFVRVPFAAALFALLYVVPQIQQHTVLSHHPLSLMLSDLTLLLLLRYRQGEPWSLPLAALSCTACTLCTQSQGALTLLAALGCLFVTRPLSRRSWLLESAVIVGLCMGVWLGVVLWLLFHGALGPAFYDCVEWVLTSYRHFNATGVAYFDGRACIMRALRGTGSLIRRMDSATTAAFLGYGQVAAFCMYPILRRRWPALLGHSHARRELDMLVIFAVAAWAACFGLPNPMMVVQTSTLGYLAALGLCVLLIWHWTERSHAQVRRLIRAAPLAVLFLQLSAAASHQVRETRRTQRVNIAARGQSLWVDPSCVHRQASLLEFLRAKLPRGSAIFAVHWSAWLYHLGDYRNPTRYDGLIPIYNNPEQLQEAVRDLDSTRPEYVLCDDVIGSLVKRGDPRFLKLKDQDPNLWPHMKYIHQHYELAKDFGGLRLYQRKDSIARCLVGSHDSTTTDAKPGLSSDGPGLIRQR